MNPYKKILYVLFIALFLGCAYNTKTDKHQFRRNNIVNVHDKVKEIEINEDDALIGPVVRLYLLQNYLIIANPKTINKLIYLFDKNSFKYVTAIGNRGQGPGEIANIGYIASNEADRKFYVSDLGKQVIFSYGLDSVLSNPLYLPQVKMRMNKGFFPDRYQYINDTLSYCRIIEPIENVDFRDAIGIFNMNTGEIKEIGNKHSNLKKNRIGVAVSMENGIYVEYSHNYDLLTICSLNGDLKSCIYGPDWSSQLDRKNHFGKVVFIKNKMLASYSGGNYYTDEYFTTKFFVFDITGNYLQTIDVGYKITDYCYDKENNRIIMNLNDADMQFAYLDLDGIIEK